MVGRRRKPGRDIIRQHFVEDDARCGHRLEPEGFRIFDQRAAEAVVAFGSGWRLRARLSEALGVTHLRHEQIHGGPRQERVRGKPHDEETTKREQAP